MNRLTDRSKEIPLPRTDNGVFWARVHERIARCEEKLARYEDSGLEPEECAKYAQAEKEGRLLVLPCKVGDTVFDIQDGHVSVLTVESIHIWPSGAIRISAHTDKTSMYWKLRPEGFGKKFFLNREAAEKALEGMK